MLSLSTNAKTSIFSRYPFVLAQSHIDLTVSNSSDASLFGQNSIIFVSLTACFVLMTIHRKRKNYWDDF